jgi:peptide/nickel transport system permease protein
VQPRAPGLQQRLHELLPEVAADLSLDLHAAQAGEDGATTAVGPGRLALRRLRRNRVALAAGVVFALLVALAIAAPLWADIADNTPTRNGLSDTIREDGRTVDVVALDGVPIGPTWHRRYLLGADSNGRDVAVRLLYGARNSLLIGIGAALMTTLLAVVLGMLAGYFRGWVDAIISRGLDVLWAFPVILLGVALGVSLATGGIQLPPWNALGWEDGPALTVGPGSKWIPVLVIGAVGVTYLARPVRGQVLALREKEFVEAARAQGAGPVRIMVGELLPNVASTVLVFFPLLVANSILLEAALSFLGAGVQPPDPSWGTMMSDGLELLITSPHLTVAPGLMLVLTVLALNVFGDGVRDALDPRARLPVETER